MKRIAFLIVFCASLLCAHAETIILHTGARVKGTVVFQNEEVVIVRNEEGKRFQYMRADVEQILTEEQTIEEAQEVEAEEEEVKVTKKASILLEVAGGAAVKPTEAAGGGVAVDLLVGSHMLGGKHIFVGGGVGYHGFFMGAEKYNFLPIQVAVRMPLMEQKHAPAFGVAVGYGIALSKTYLGGIYADVDFGYRCQLNPNTALGLFAFAQFQQAVVPSTTIVDGNPYTQNIGRSLVMSGVKLSLYF